MVTDLPGSLTGIDPGLLCGAGVTSHGTGEPALNTPNYAQCTHLTGAGKVALEGILQIRLPSDAWANELRNISAGLRRAERSRSNYHIASLVLGKTEVSENIYFTTCRHAMTVWIRNELKVKTLEYQMADLRNLSRVRKQQVGELGRGAGLVK